MTENELSASQQYAQTEKGKAALRRAQQKYLASEKGKAARAKASRRQAEKKKQEREAQRYERAIEAERYRAEKVFLPKLRSLGALAKEKLLRECREKNPALHQAIARAGGV